MKRAVTVILLIGLLAGVSPAVTFNWTQVGTGVGPGSAYDSYDLDVTTTTDLALVEIYIQSYAPAAGDFHINATQPYLSDETYDTSVSLFPAPATMSSLGLGYPGDPDANGPAIDIVPDDPPGAPVRIQSFDDQLLDFSWGAADGTGTGPLTNQVVARVTVKQGLLYGSWQAYALEVGDNTEYTASHTLAGFPLYGAYPGDANLDKSVSIADFAILQNNYNQPGPWAWTDADFTGDTNVTIADFAPIQNNYGDTWPLPPEPPTSVPEPTTSCILLLSLVGLAITRRKGRKV